MHELAICQALIGEIESQAKARQAECVTAVHLEIGPLAGVESELLKRAYSIATAGTIAENARLVIEMLPVRVRCQLCHAESDATVNRLVCGACGDWHTSVVSGDELLLSSIEMTTRHTLH